MIKRLLSRRCGEAEMRYAPAPFVVEAARPGTTLLRLMLDSHPELTIPSETYFVLDLIDAASEQDVS